jgi:hypothetical protein
LEKLESTLAEERKKNGELAAGMKSEIDKWKADMQKAQGKA